MPHVTVSPSMRPNAFATSRSPHATRIIIIADGLSFPFPVTRSKASHASELMHVKHRDVLIGSIAAAVATAISFVADMAMWGAMSGEATTKISPAPSC